MSELKDRLSPFFLNAEIPEESHEKMIEAIESFVGSMAILLQCNEEAAPNFMTFGCSLGDDSDYELTVRKSGGKVDPQFISDKFSDMRLVVDSKIAACEALEKGERFSNYAADIAEYDDKVDAGAVSDLLDALRISILNGRTMATAADNEKTDRIEFRRLWEESKIALAKSEAENFRLNQVGQKLASHLASTRGALHEIRAIVVEGPILGSSIVPEFKWEGTKK